VADAIERGDMKDLREELGDLLLQPIYHAQMASEEGLFTIEDVIKDVTAKMIARHPHVFGDTDAQSPEDVNKIWDEKKSKEKARESALDGVAQALPALLRAEKLLSRAAKTGFEWEKPEHVLDKFEEELAEMREALKNGSIDEKKDELGDLMFLLVNFGRMLDINAETALRECNDKFEFRYRGMEKEIKVKYQNMGKASLADMEQEWDNQKAKERV